MPELKKLSEFGFSRWDILSAEEILKTWVPKKRDIIAKYWESVAMAVKWILLLWRETGVNVIKEPLLLSKIRAGIMKIPGWAGNLRIETARRVFLALVSEPIGVPEGISCPDMFAEWEKSPDVSEVLDAAIVDKTMFFQNFWIYIHSVFLDESENKDDTVLRSIVWHLYRKGIGANGLFKILSGLRESAIRTYYKNNSKAVNDRFIYMMERMLSAYSVIAEEDRVNSEENARKTAVFENNERMYVEALNL